VNTKPVNSAPKIVIPAIKLAIHPRAFVPGRTGGSPCQWSILYRAPEKVGAFNQRSAGRMKFTIQIVLDQPDVVLSVRVPKQIPPPALVNIPVLASGTGPDCLDAE
jgi:hypothetical protein